MATNEAYIEAIKKTGFVLENQIAQQMKANGWTVISNKYYEDDHSGTVREVDLLAYKVRLTPSFNVFTVLLASCKKSADHAWALLSREINPSDPNADWWPMHAWSNDPALRERLADTSCPKRFHEAASKLGVKEALSMPSVEVFAFQELSKNTAQASTSNTTQTKKIRGNAGSQPKNDTAIFSAITSLMKAQAYELNALPNRKKKPCVYQFNLISVAETDLLRMMFKDSDIECTPIEHEHYIGRYIIQRKETFSRIRFIRANAFEKCLNDYDRLHESNCKWFISESDDFYADILKDNKRTKILIDAFRKEVHNYVKWKANSEFKEIVNMEDADLVYSKKDDLVHIYVDASERAIDSLNKSQSIKERIAKALEKVYRYKGEFEFTVDIPF